MENFNLFNVLIILSNLIELNYVKIESEQTSIEKEFANDIFKIIENYVENFVEESDHEQLYENEEDNIQINEEWSPLIDQIPNCIVKNFMNTT